MQKNNEKINELLIKNHSLQKSCKLLEDYEIKVSLFSIKTKKLCNFMIKR